MLEIDLKEGQCVKDTHIASGETRFIRVLSIRVRPDGSRVVKLGFDDPPPWKFATARPDWRGRPDDKDQHPAYIITKSAE